MRMGVLIGAVLLWAHVTRAWQLDPSAYVTRWASEVSPTNAHPEYPRPMMTRPDWLNLNGLWECGLTRGTDAPSFTGQILVPFPIESPLAGERRTLNEFERFWYRRTFTIPPGWQGRRVLLHFDAVNWESEVWINGQEIGTHKGGYDQFSFDVTEMLRPGQEQELTVAVRNPSDAGPQPRGKQMLRPRPPFYRTSSGIWQTVWLEPVAETSIEALHLAPELDKRTLSIEVSGRGNTNMAVVEAIAYVQGKEISRAKGRVGESFQLRIRNVRPWSPEDPFLYDLKVILSEKGRKVDEVSSYFGMRKVSVAKGADGHPRLYLNDKPYFELGVLDQGYWPDGLYTAPNDEALRSDAKLIRDLGFNLCRVHVKVEPERWYYWCDKLGILVWQDMPNGDDAATPQKKEINKDPKSARQFETELSRMIAGHWNHPSILIWIPFNQGWGQYDTVRITELVKKLDPSRLVIDASGWNDFGVGDVRSLHQYPGPAPLEEDGHRACVIGECGGLGMAVSGHLWSVMTYWNTTVFDSSDALAAGYESLAARLRDEEGPGLSGAVVTGLTDVESECDGFITYDRAILKMPEAKVKLANQDILSFSNKSGGH